MGILFVFHPSFCLCVPIAICRCCFGIPCSVFTEQHWNMHLDRESQSLRPAPSHPSQLAAAPGYPRSRKAFLSAFLPTLPIPPCKSLLVTARPHRDRAVLAHPVAVCMCQPVTLVLAWAIFCFLPLLPRCLEHPWSSCHPILFYPLASSLFLKLFVL